MKPPPILEADRDAQVVALWQGRPREQRRAADVDAFCQWLVDYPPWLLSGDAEWREQIRTLLQPHIVEDDDANGPNERPRRPRVPRRKRVADANDSSRTY
jgi:hypothetical protein